MSSYALIHKIIRPASDLLLVSSQQAFGLLVILAPAQHSPFVPAELCFSALQQFAKITLACLSWPQKLPVVPSTLLPSKDLRIIPSNTSHKTFVTILCSP